MLRASVLVAGIWLGFMVASWLVASANFRTAERVAGPEASAEITRRLGPVAAEDRRFVLRYMASEINRWMFRTWSWAQLALALLLLAAAWPLGAWPRGLALLALALVLLQAFGLAGPITELGRSIDFVARPLPPELGRRFGLLHGAYVLADLAKAGILLALSAVLLRRP